MRDLSDRALLRALFDAALAASLPDGRFAGLLPARPEGRTLVLAAGKGAARMAAAFEEEWGEPVEGLAVTRYGHAVPTRFVEVVEAAHPVPDAAGLAAAGRMLQMARGARPGDLVVFLISGGASALLSLPADGITLDDKRAITTALLKSGAAIDEMNTVRKSLSAIKGGRLAAAASGARRVTYLISDVPGDDPGVIGSGPSIPERATTDRAFAILDRYGIEVPPHVAEAMRRNVPADVERGTVHMLATPKMALDAAAAKARELGLTPLLLGDAIEGNAAEVGTVMAGIAKFAAAHGEPVKAPCVLLSGGETTVIVRGKGRGGRNAEFLLSLAIHLGGVPGVSAIACDTDGIDGSEDNAGAWIDAEVLAEARLAGLDPLARLADNDAYTLFEALDRLVVTGPTFTNVNDFRAIVVR